MFALQETVSESNSDPQASQCSSVLDMGNEPYQPDPKFIKVQKLRNKKLRFQAKWFSQYPWLHYSPTLQKVLCFECVKAYTIKKTTLEKRNDPAFCSNGFNNWKHAVECFNRHKKSKAHHHSLTVNALEQTPVHTQISSSMARLQEEARYCLKQIMGSLRYLSRQVAFRGHEVNDGNFYYLVKFLATKDPILSSWFKRCHDYISPQCQNEYLALFANTIVSEIASTIRSLSVLQFSIIMDGTQDIQGKEQVSICLRYVDQDLVPQEVFVGLYEVLGTTGEQMAKLAIDVLLRLNIPICGL